MKEKGTNWEAFEDHIFDKGFVFIATKELSKLSSMEANIELKTTKVAIGHLKGF